MGRPRTPTEPTPVGETAAEKVARLEAELAAARQDVAVDSVPTRARARTRVDSTSISTDSSSLKEGATARRWSRDDLRAHLAHAPTLSDEWLDEEVLGRACEGYTLITGDPVRKPKKRNLVAADYRIHRDDFLPYVRNLFEATGTAINLLGILRLSPPRNLVSGVPAAAPPLDSGADPMESAANDRQPVGAESDEGPVFEGWPTFSAPHEESDEEWSSDPWAPVQVVGDDLLPGLLYGESDRPSFDPTSTRRWDDRASNPDRDAILAERARCSGRAAVGSER